MISAHDPAHDFCAPMLNTLMNFLWKLSAVVVTVMSKPKSETLSFVMLILLSKRFTKLENPEGWYTKLTF